MCFRRIKIKLKNFLYFYFKPLNQSRTNMNILQTYIQVFRQANAYSLYILFVMLVVYMLNQLDRYALSITSVETAQSLHYGDKSCLPLPGFPKDTSKLCKNLTQSVCEQFVINGTNGTVEHLCKYDYNGQGIEYQVHK